MHITSKLTAETPSNKPPNYLWRFVGAQGIACFFYECYLISLPWIIYSITQDPSDLMFIIGMAHLPRTLFLLFSGGLIDRFSPLTTLRIAYSCRLLAILGLMALFSMSLVTREIFYAVVIIIGLCEVLIIPSQNAIIPKIVSEEKLVSANIKINTAVQLGYVLGPIFTAIAFSATYDSTSIAQTDISYLYLIISVGYAVSLLGITQIKAPFSKDNLAVNYYQQFKQSMQFIINNRNVRMLLLLGLAFNWFVISPITIALPLMVKQMNIAEYFYGLLTSTFCIGFILGALITPKIKPYFEQVNMAICFWSVLLCALFISMLTLPSISLYFAGMLAMGVIYGIFNIIITSWLQRFTPQQYMGQVMSVLTFTAIGTIPLCSILYRQVPNDMVQQVLLIGALIGLVVFLVLMIYLNKQKRALLTSALCSDARGTQ